MQHLKPAEYRSRNAHSITDSHVNVGEMKIAAERRQLVVLVVKTENFAGLRDEIVNIMQGNAAEADFLNAIYFALNQTIKVMHAYGTTAVSDI